MLFYFGVLQHFAPMKVAIILLFSLVGIAGSYGVAWFGIRVNTFANSRAAFAGLARQAVSDLRDSAQRRDEHRHAPHQRRAVHHALHPPVHPGRLRRRVLHRLRDRRVARRRRTPHRRRHLHQDCRYRRRPDEDRLQHQGRRRAQPGRHRRLHRRQRRRLGRPERRRVRNLRRHRRRAHLVHPRRRHRPARAGAAARVDFRDARDRGDCQRRVVPAERGVGEGPLCGRGDDELRDAADHAGVAHVDRLGGAHLHGVVLPDSGPRRRPDAVVEAVDGHHLRHACRRDHPRAREGVHLDRVRPRARSGHVVARRRRVAQHALRTRRGELQRLLAGHGASWR